MSQVPSTPGSLVEVILEGGPSDLPADLRAGRFTSDTEKVKIPHYGGYEHFERATADGARPVVFRWTGRTRVAE
jgi:hypothetical protein